MGIRKPKFISNHGDKLLSQQQHSHKDVILFHDLVEALVPSINFMEPMIVDVSNYHLQR